MQFVRGSVLESSDGIYTTETKVKGGKQNEHGGLDYFSNRDNFVSETTTKLKNLNTAGLEERKEEREKRILRSLGRAQSRDDDDNEEGPTDYGPASVTLEEFDFVQAHDNIRRRKEIEDGKDVIKFRCQQQQQAEECGILTQDDLFESVAKAERQKHSIDAALSLKVKAKLTVTKRNSTAKPADSSTITNYRPSSSFKKSLLLKGDDKYDEWELLSCESTWDKFVPSDTAEESPFVSDPCHSSSSSSRATKRSTKTAQPTNDTATTSVEIVNATTALRSNDVMSTSSKRRITAQNATASDKNECVIIEKPENAAVKLTNLSLLVDDYYNEEFK